MKKCPPLHTLFGDQPHVTFFLLAILECYIYDDMNRNMPHDPRMEVLRILFLLVAVVTHYTTLPVSCSTNSLSVRVGLTHIDAEKGYTRTKLITRAAQRSKARAARLSRRLGSTVHPSDGEYVFNLAIGTPPLYYRGLLDTGSDLIWTQCDCMQCVPQPTPHFDPFHSSSFAPIPCTHKLCRSLAMDGRSTCGPNSCIYSYDYGDTTSSIGFMGTETFTFVSSSGENIRVPRLGFGCGLFNGGDINNSSGLIGFGRGPISLISQLGVDAFSYCFTEFFRNDSTGTLFMGSSLASLTGPNVITTPLIPLNPMIRPYSSFYHVLLKGISVGNTLLPIPPETFQVNEDGTGGTIVDSGTALLQLETRAYKPFVEAFRTQVKMPTVNMTGLAVELCYKTAPKIPRLIFHLEGGDWELPHSNYLIQDDELMLYCLAVQESSPSIIGNLQTQNIHVLYDLKNEKISFMPAKCSQL